MNKNTKFNAPSLLANFWLPVTINEQVRSATEEDLSFLSGDH